MKSCRYYVVTLKDFTKEDALNMFFGSCECKQVNDNVDLWYETIRSMFEDFGNHFCKLKDLGIDYVVTATR